MSYNIPIDRWVSVHNWQPKNHVNSVLNKFMFYHVRPTETVSLAHIMDCGDVIISPYQVSLIAGIRGEYFSCIGVKSKHLDNQACYLYSELMTYRDLGQAAIWYLNVKNFFQGPWEVFNGPGHIDISV